MMKGLEYPNVTLPATTGAWLFFKSVSGNFEVIIHQKDMRAVHIWMETIQRLFRVTKDR